MGLILLLIIVSKRKITKKLENFELLKRDLEVENQNKFASKGVQFILKFRDQVMYGNQRSYTIQVPFIELIFFDPIATQIQIPIQQPFEQPQIYQNTQQFVPNFPSQNNYHY
jgi:hypothetical protein